MTHPPRVEHSPLPWIAEDMCIKQADGKVVMHLEDFYPSDAAFIVEACNAYEANQKALRVAVEGMQQIIDEDSSCDRCGGDGRLWADGQAHYPSFKGETVSCTNCGGTGNAPMNSIGIAKSALERIREIQEGV